MKRAIAILAFLSAASSLSAQSVVELARLEKARRESYKGTRVKVVTNESLTEIHRTPAIIVTQETAAAAPPAEGEGAELPQPNPAIPRPTRTMVPNVVSNGGKLFGTSDIAPPTGPPEERLKAAEETVNLLTEQMNMLLQEANNLNTMTPRDVIMQQVEETSKKLEEAKDVAAKLKTQVEAAKKNPPGKR